MSISVVPKTDKKTNIGLYKCVKDNFNFTNGDYIKLLDDIIKDIEQYPFTHYSFIYKNYQCDIKRNHMDCYLAYVDVQNKTNYGIIDDNSLTHYGITGSLSQNYSVGFDFQHGSDFWPRTFIDSPDMLANKKRHDSSEKFRSFEYVYNFIKSMIDQMEDIRNQSSDSDSD